MSELEEALVMWLQTSSVPAPVREHAFHPTRKWRFDFAWVDQQIAVEVEGGSWVGGAHNRGQGFEKDCEKYAEAAIAGWRVLRVTTDMVEDGRAIQYIERALGVGAA